jgi:hypothetical protein
MEHDTLDMQKHTPVQVTVFGDRVQEHCVPSG